MKYVKIVLATILCICVACTIKVTVDGDFLTYVTLPKVDIIDASIPDAGMIVDASTDASTVDAQ